VFDVQAEDRKTEDEGEGEIHRQASAVRLEDRQTAQDEVDGRENRVGCWDAGFRPGRAAGTQTNDVTSILGTSSRSGRNVQWDAGLDPDAVGRGKCKQQQWRVCDRWGFGLSRSAVRRLLFNVDAHHETEQVACLLACLLAC
jgi:hypothetical protein